MKNIFTKLATIYLLLTVSSCALFNSKTVSVPISSNPAGADIYIDGNHYGRTPSSVTLEPSKSYKATLVKPGYGTATIDMDTWYSVRGGRGYDTTRCVLDALGVMIVFPAIGFYSVHCRDFTKESYMVNITNSEFPSPSGMNEIKKPESNFGSNNYNPYNNPYNNPYGSSGSGYGSGQ